MHGNLYKHGVAHVNYFRRDACLSIIGGIRYVSWQSAATRSQGALE